MASIKAWRITAATYQDSAFSGEGAKEYGGRFNSVGTPLVYTAGSLALATLELMANLNNRRRLMGRVQIPVFFDEEHVLIQNASDLPDGWDASQYGEATQEIGDQWVRSQKSLVLRVQSAVVPEEHNYLINPTHPDFESIEIGDPKPLSPDPRLVN